MNHWEYCMHAVYAREIKGLRNHETVELVSPKMVAT